MSRERKPKHSTEVPADLKIIFQPHFESVDEFEKRTIEVQEMLTKIILLAGKRGRPSLKEEVYEEAA